MQSDGSLRYLPQYKYAWFCSWRSLPDGVGRGAIGYKDEVDAQGQINDHYRRYLNKLNAKSLSKINRYYYKDTQPYQS